MANYSSRRLWKAPRIKTLQEIEWERKESRKLRFRRVGLFLVYTLIFLSLFF